MGTARSPRRRKVIVAFAVAGAVVAVGAPALACVAFEGSMILTPLDGPRPGTIHAVSGNGIAHGYCAAPNDGGPLVNLNQPGQRILVEVAPTSCGGRSSLPTNTYHVAVVNGEAYTTTGGYASVHTFQGGWGCWSTSQTYASRRHFNFPGSTFQVVAGVGSTVVTLPALPFANTTMAAVLSNTGPSDASVLCVGDAVPNPNDPNSTISTHGIFAPITVL